MNHIHFHASPYDCLKFCPSTVEVFDKFLKPFIRGDLNMHRSLVTLFKNFYDSGPEQLPGLENFEDSEYYHPRNYWFLINRKPKRLGSMEPKRTVGDFGVWKPKGKPEIVLDGLTAGLALGTKQLLLFSYNEQAKMKSGWHMIEYAPAIPSQPEGRPAQPLVFQEKVIVNLYYNAEEDHIRQKGVALPLPGLPSSLPGLPSSLPGLQDRPDQIMGGNQLVDQPEEGRNQITGVNQTGTGTSAFNQPGTGTAAFNQPGTGTAAFNQPVANLRVNQPGTGTYAFTALNQPDDLFYDGYNIDALYGDGQDRVPAQDDIYDELSPLEARVRVPITQDRAGEPDHATLRESDGVRVAAADDPFGLDPHINKTSNRNRRK